MTASSGNRRVCRWAWKTRNGEVGGRSVWHQALGSSWFAGKIRNGSVWRTNVIFLLRWSQGKRRPVVHLS